MATAVRGEANKSRSKNTCACTCSMHSGEMGLSLLATQRRVASQFNVGPDVPGPARVAATAYTAWRPWFTRVCELGRRFALGSRNPPSSPAISPWGCARGVRLVRFQSKPFERLLTCLLSVQRTTRPNADSGHCTGGGLRSGAINAAATQTQRCCVYARQALEP